MSYVNLICPSCKNKHEVSNFYLKNNNLISSEELAKQLCSCSNFKKTFDESIVEDYDKQVLILRYHEGLTLAQIASVYECAVSTADRRCTTSLRKLQNILGGDTPFR